MNVHEHGPTVLVALDESPVSARAAQAAVKLFASTPNASFVAVNVSRLPVPWVGTAGFGAAGPMLFDRTWLDTAGRPDDTDQWALIDRARVLGVPDPDADVRVGDPIRQICAAADEHHADVIVVGSHEKSALQRLFDPSVADGVVRRTPRPVLVVSGEDEST